MTKEFRGMCNGLVKEFITPELYDYCVTVFKRQIDQEYGDGTFDEHYHIDRSLYDKALDDPSVKIAMLIARPNGSTWDVLT